MSGRPVTARISERDYLTALVAGGHPLQADEPAELGGSDQGPTPDELLAAALGACTAITLKMYARRKGWPLEGVDVDLEVIEQDGTRSIRRRVKPRGPLSPEQRERLGQIANACPVHKMLVGLTVVETTLAD